jgi:hypothetical protein
MKIVIYQEGKLSAIYEDINNPKIKGDIILFDGGQIEGINGNHILVEDEIDPGAELTPDMLELDKKNTLEAFKTFEDLQAERIANLENALLAVLDML